MEIQGIKLREVIMSKWLKRALIAPVLSLVCGLMSISISAEEIIIKADQLRLNATLNLVTDSIDEGPLVLLVHGTLGHKDMEIIANLQTLLADEEINSLAINLSLGIDNRQGPFDCAVPHDHRHEDAVEEIATWIKWLKGQDVNHVLLAGHSRGGSQVAAYSQNADAIVMGQVLIAPSTWSRKYAAKAYQDRYQKSLEDLIAVATQQITNGWMPEPTSLVYCANALKVKAASFLSYYQPPQTLNTPDLLVEGGLPTLVLGAGDDQIVKDLPQQMQLRDFSNVEFIMVDDADHFFRDLYADDVVEAMIENIFSLLEQD
jgi:pimeloyl-ACP methyl ester carboxylesterase